MAKVKNISRSGGGGDGGGNTYARTCARTEPRVHTWQNVPAHTRERVIRSLEAASRDIGDYIPAGADLVVNLARADHFWSALTRAGLSSENLAFTPRNRGVGICRKSHRGAGVRRALNARVSRARTTRLRGRIWNIEIYRFLPAIV